MLLICSDAVLRFQAGRYDEVNASRGEECVFESSVGRSDR